MKFISRITFSVVTLILVVTTANAQTKGNERMLKWQAPTKMTISDDFVSQYLIFEGSSSSPEYGKVPLYGEAVNLPSGANDFNITITGIKTQPLSGDEQAALAPMPTLPSAITPNKKIIYQNGKPIGSFSFPAVIKTTTGSYEKVISFSYNYTTFNTPQPKNNNSFIASSVLSSGRWYKIAVTGNGVYKIDQALLNQLGMNVSSINPNNIRIYGNGGGMLPALNSAPRIDDLSEIAIEVTGAGDNSFDAGDYILFYGEGQTVWEYNTNTGRYTHTVNQYSDTTYYFITADLGAGKRISNQSPSSETPTYTATTFTDYALHEKDEINLIRSGSTWFGEKFDILTEYSFSFNFPNITTSTPVKASIGIAGFYQANASANYNLKYSGSNIGTFSIPGVGINPLYVAGAYTTYNVDFNATSATIPLTITKLTSSAQGWLDYIELTAKRNLNFTGQQMQFRSVDGVGTGQITKFIVGNASGIRIWDITDHQNVANQQFNLNGLQAEFSLATPVVREFIAFNGAAYGTPIPVGAVDNQNLHATAQVDMVIVSAPQFLNQANQLADLHRNNDNMTVVVTTPQAIYNEFSSGSRDILAIRSFVRMLYKRAQTADEQPQYLLLFGDGSYDNKFRLSENSNFIPTYETEESLNIIGSQTADDYYGLLDDNEGQYIAVEAIDIGLGRIPCSTVGQAQTVVDKITDYVNVAGQRDWRNIITFFADDQDSGAHLDQANSISGLITDATNSATYYPSFNVDKVFFDSYVQESTSGGQRYPEVKDILNKRVNKGDLIINYTGHGGEAGWAAEKILELSDIDTWTNKYNLPAFVTATCEFSKFDDPARTSAGEYVLINDNGGICLFTTTRVVYSQPNFTLNTKFYQKLLTDLKAGSRPRMGDLYKFTKVAMAQQGDGNSRNFTLLGDPAVRLNYPIHDVVTTEINGNPVTQTSIDTIKALQLVTVKGYIKSRTAPGILTGYNGTIYPTVYDKPSSIQTLMQDTDSPLRTYKVQRNIIYKGKASVVNGEFTFTFPVPKDISYQYGYGKISYYAENGVRDEDAHGYKELVIGGSDTSNFCDNIGPDISLYMNSTTFANGGTTDPNPTLLVFLADTNGINTVGTGIGHDLVAILDNNTSSPFILNDSYEADLNMYSRGRVTYPFSNLSEGPHSLRVKAWDVCNNSNETTLDFVVARSADLALNHVLNYPNPFTTNTCFMFEHNRPNQVLDVQLQVFTVSGKLVKTINTSVTGAGFRADCISWDGLDDYGDKIGRGVYIYRLKVTDEQGKKADKYEKLVILN